ncbi:hypothetical protein VitviT2T_029444 [Vitis vinifera]|uniref:DOG1 domain-containing protein n=2 Tax=Vitis vinifera TaxID=29760 RepID=A0ABY9DWP1_VITVI|nr:protein DOG1-like 4 [Vitis vinifera]WKA12003.1 hypothetical protein VitviT2T_029444 [Vitis vinifera]|eukprot:XP_002283108.1 PREDICTED: protein DOG1-like 4 [Vitis vinifera]
MSFHRFYASWFDHLNHLVHQLTLAPKPTTPQDNPALLQLVQKVISHYSQYYRAKSVAAQNDAVSLFAAPWSSSLERSLHWVAGWRPTIVFHLIYTETSARFESHIADILHGVRTGDLGDLSTAQLHRVSELQCETVREENEITRELAKWQEGAVELVEAGGDGNVEEKIGGLMSVLVKADELRMRTIWRVAEMLTPQQAVEFLIAAAELQFGVRVLGLNHDNQRENV